jgi:large subunit ribosomal protein L21e
MVLKSHGGQVKARNRLRKRPRDRGKYSVSKYVQPFKNGDQVIIKVEPSVKENTIHHRFMSKKGVVIGKRGNAYIINVDDLGKSKTVYVIPIHLKKVGEAK